MKSKGLFGRDINESHVPCVRFWTGIFAVMFYLGNMKDASLLFFGQTVFFVFLSYPTYRADVHLYFRCLLDNLFCRIYILFCVHYGSRTGRPLKKDDPDGSSFFMFYKVNPLMNGFCSCSVAMSVSGPCPLNTSVSSGSVSSF